VKIVPASSGPRRAELLRQCCPSFQIRAPNIDEKNWCGKADTSLMFRNFIVIAADRVVAILIKKGKFSKNSFQL
jgi:predicted house-cleaning NTP pyrophosphatase (Maf/HAM1 superfamily)